MIVECLIGKDGVSKLNYWPVVINSQYQPKIVTGHLGRRIKEKIVRHSLRIEKARLAEKEPQRKQYMKKAARAYLKFRVSSYLYFLAHLHLYPLSMIKQSVLRSLRRRFVT